MKCLLIGNFGVGNLGDEALKEYFLQEFPSVDWTVVSAHPAGDAEVPRLPGGIRSFLSFSWLKTMSAYRKCDAVVFGGGSLFTDTESAYACFLWWLHAKLAFLLGKDVHLAFQGIGPFKTRFGERLCLAVCKRAASISVRDALSHKRVGEWGLTQNSVQSFDPVFSLIESRKIDICTKNILVVIPRKNSGDKFTEATQKKIKSMHPASVRILSMQSDCKSEIEFCQKLASSIDIECSVQKVCTLDELLRELSSADFVISERYHGALAALALGKDVEVVSQREGDKLSTLQNQEDVNAGLLRDGEQLLRNALQIE